MNGPITKRKTSSAPWLCRTSLVILLIEKDMIKWWRIERHCWLMGVRFIEWQSMFRLSMSHLKLGWCLQKSKFLNSNKRKLWGDLTYKTVPYMNIYTVPVLSSYVFGNAMQVQIGWPAPSMGRAFPAVFFPRVFRGRNEWPIIAVDAMRTSIGTVHRKTCVFQCLLFVQSISQFFAFPVCCLGTKMSGLFCFTGDFPGAGLYRRASIGICPDLAVSKCFTRSSFHWHSV